MPFKVALAAMPWPLADRPSIQLATLKAYLDQHLKGTVICRAYHPYLEIAKALGLKIYHTIAGRSWLAETVYAPLLFPEQLEAASQLFERLRPKQIKHLVRFDDLLNTITGVHSRQRLVEALAEYDLVGISICFSQLTSSLYLIHQLKLTNPKLRVVLGGSTVCGSMGHSLLRVFPQIDYVISGEGEKALKDLVNCLQNGRDPREEKIQGLFWRDPSGEIKGEGCSQIISLDTLPIPAYEDFFNELNKLSDLGRILVSLPVETSRGCWWQASRRSCLFCNLNLQWKGYRSKTPQKVVWEINSLVERYKSLRIVLVDNTLNPATAERTFQGIGRLGKSLHIFSELRVPLTPKQLQTMRLAGLQQVQIGIEALSTRLLAKMGKGTRAIDNIAAMKWCEQYGITNLSNLMLEFPGSDEEDVRQTLEALEFVSIYRPLRAVKFWLGEGSAICTDPASFGIKAVVNHRWYKALFPQSIFSRLNLMVKEYRGDVKKQRLLWRPVRNRLREWKKNYNRFRRKHFEKPELGYSDGGDFLVIRRRRLDSDSHEAFRLSGRSREIYLACDVPREFSWLTKRFSDIPTSIIENFLTDLIQKKVMYHEDNTYLSLAVNEDIRRFCNER